MNKPSKTLFKLMIVVSALFILNCAANDPISKLINHYKDIMVILEENKDDASHAAKVLAEYMNGKENEFKNLKSELDTQLSIGKTNPEETAEKAVKFSSVITLFQELNNNYESLLNNAEVNSALKPFLAIY